MNLLDTLTHYAWGILQTGLGFLQTMWGFILVRFYHSIPVFLVWNFIVINIFALPYIPFLAMWAILIAFDNVRFDITKLYETPTPKEE